MHVAESVFQFLTGIEVWGLDAIKSLVVVIQEGAELEIDGCRIGLVDHLAIQEVGEGGHAVFGDDVMGFAMVADGDADFV